MWMGLRVNCSFEQLKGQTEFDPVIKAMKHLANSAVSYVSLTNGYEGGSTSTSMFYSLNVDYA